MGEQTISISDQLELRFAIIEDGKQYSMQWRTWSYGNNLFIAPRSPNYGKRVNFHFAEGDGYNHFTTREYNARIVEGDDVTLLDRLSWHRKATPALGDTMLHLMSVIFPHEMANEEPYQLNPKKPVYELPRPGSGKSWIVSLHLTKPPPSNQPYAYIETDDYKVLDVAKFRDDELAVVLARRVVFDATAFWKRHEAGVNEGIKTGRWLAPIEAGGKDNMRCHLWNDPREDGILKIWEFGQLKLKPK